MKFHLYKIIKSTSISPNATACHKHSVRVGGWCMFSDGDRLRLCDELAADVQRH